MKVPNWVSLIMLGLPSMITLVTDLGDAGKIAAPIVTLLIAVLMAMRKWWEEQQSEPQNPIQPSATPMQTAEVPKWKRIWLN